MRRLLVLLLTRRRCSPPAPPRSTAKPGRKSPRLHAFRSCTNLLGYAQRNGAARDPPDAVRFGRRRRRCRSRRRAAATAGAAAARRRPSPVPAPVAAPAPARGRGPRRRPTCRRRASTSPTGSRPPARPLYVARDGKLRAFDASGDPPRELDSLDLPGFTHELLRPRRPRARDLHARLRRREPGRDRRRRCQRAAVAAGSGRTRLLEVDVSDPAAPMRVLRDARRRGLLPQRAAHRRDRARRRARPSRAGSSMPDDGATRRSARPRATGGGPCAARGPRAWLPSRGAARPPHGQRQRGARSCAAGRCGARRRSPASAR